MENHANKENGVEKLIKLPEEIYGEDEMSEYSLLSRSCLRKECWLAKT